MDNELLRNSHFIDIILINVIIMLIFTLSIQYQKEIEIKEGGGLVDTNINQYDLHECAPQIRKDMDENGCVSNV